MLAEPYLQSIVAAGAFAVAAQPVYPRLIGALMRRWRRASRRPTAATPDRVALACLAGLAAGALFGARPFALALGVGLILCELIILDCRYLWLPRRLTLPLLALGFLAAAADEAALLAAAIGAAAAWTAFTALRLCYRRLRGQDGLGAGDVTLFAAIGAWTGPDLLGPTALVAALLALLSVARRKDRRGGKLPFGAWLCVAFWIVWIGGFV